MRVTAIIAARMASTRFPNKPLARIRGLPMIGHVFYRARMAAGIDDIWIATCDESIMDYAASIGAPAVMTLDTHERATDRIAEALPLIEERTGDRVDVCVLVQGDEPMLVPDMLTELVAPMRGGDVAIANLIASIGDTTEFEDPNCVKVVRDLKGNALYFSREAIPSRRKYAGAVPMWKQLGLIAFRRDALLEYPVLVSTPLEMIESVDMNRVLEHGHRILMVETTCRTAAVDTPQDLARVELLMATDPLVAMYHGDVP